MAEYDEDELIVNVINAEIYDGLQFKLFFDIEQEDARALKILNKGENWHYYSDIYGDQLEETMIEIVKRALKPVFTKMNDMQAEIYDLRQDLVDAKSDLRDYKLQLEDAQRQMWDNS
jgi:hypothetical protein